MAGRGLGVEAGPVGRGLQAAWPGTRDRGPQSRRGPAGCLFPDGCSEEAPLVTGLSLPSPHSKSRRSGTWWRTCRDCCPRRALAALWGPNPLPPELPARGLSALDSRVPALRAPGPLGQDLASRIQPGQAVALSPPLDSASPAPRSCSTHPFLLPETPQGLTYLPAARLSLAPGSCPLVTDAFSGPSSRTRESPGAAEREYGKLYLYFYLSPVKFQFLLNVL